MEKPDMHLPTAEEIALGKKFFEIIKPEENEGFDLLEALDGVVEMTDMQKVEIILVTKGIKPACIVNMI